MIRYILRECLYEKTLLTRKTKNEESTQEVTLGSELEMGQEAAHVGYVYDRVVMAMSQVLFVLHHS